MTLYIVVEIQTNLFTKVELCKDKESALSVFKDFVADVAPLEKHLSDTELLEAFNYACYEDEYGKVIIERKDI